MTLTFSHMWGWKQGTAVNAPSTAPPSFSSLIGVGVDGGMLRGHPPPSKGSVNTDLCCPALRASFCCLYHGLITMAIRSTRVLIEALHWRRLIICKAILLADNGEKKHRSILAGHSGLQSVRNRMHVFLGVLGFRCSGLRFAETLCLLLSLLCVVIWGRLLVRSGPLFRPKASSSSFKTAQGSCWLCQRLEIIFFCHGNSSFSRAFSPWILLLVMLDALQVFLGTCPPPHPHPECVQQHCAFSACCVFTVKVEVQVTLIGMWKAAKLQLHHIFHFV